MTEAKTRQTWQRKAVLSHLKGRTDHPTAEMIGEGVRADCGCPINAATVYRALSRLRDEKLVREWKFNDSEASRYETNVERHWHFICKRCGAVKDVSRCPLPALQGALETAEGSVEDYRLDFYGVCAGCHLDQRERSLPERSEKVISN